MKLPPSISNRAAKKQSETHTLATKFSSPTSGSSTSSSRKKAKTAELIMFFGCLAILSICFFTIWASVSHRRSYKEKQALRIEQELQQQRRMLQNDLYDVQRIERIRVIPEAKQALLATNKEMRAAGRYDDIREDDDDVLSSVDESSTKKNGSQNKQKKNNSSSSSSRPQQLLSSPPVNLHKLHNIIMSQNPIYGFSKTEAIAKYTLREDVNWKEILSDQDFLQKHRQEQESIQRPKRYTRQENQAELARLRQLRYDLHHGKVKLKPSLQQQLFPRPASQRRQPIPKVPMHELKYCQTRQEELVNHFGEAHHHCDRTTNRSKKDNYNTINDEADDENNQNQNQEQHEHEHHRRPQFIPPFTRLSKHHRPKIAIISIAIKSEKLGADNTTRRNFMHKYTFWNKLQYCRLHNYDFILEGEDAVDESRPPHWSKIRVLRRWLPFYDWVVYMDLDTLFTDFNFRFENLVTDEIQRFLLFDLHVQEELAGISHSTEINYTSSSSSSLNKNSSSYFPEFEKREIDLILTQDQNGINSGVMVLRNSQWTRNFLRRCWGVPSVLVRPWYDQGSFLYLINTMQRFYRDPFEAAIDRSHVFVMADNLINSYPNALIFMEQDTHYKWRPGRAIIHFPSCKSFAHCLDWLKFHYHLAFCNVTKSHFSADFVIDPPVDFNPPDSYLPPDDTQSIATYPPLDEPIWDVSGIGLLHPDFRKYWKEEWSVLTQFGRRKPVSSSNNNSSVVSWRGTRNDDMNNNNNNHHSHGRLSRRRRRNHYDPDAEMASASTTTTTVNSMKQKRIDEKQQQATKIDKKTKKTKEPEVKDDEYYLPSNLQFSRFLGVWQIVSRPPGTYERQASSSSSQRRSGGGNSQRSNSLVRTRGGGRFGVGDDDAFARDDDYNKRLASSINQGFIHALIAIVLLVAIAIALLLSMGDCCRVNKKMQQQPMWKPNNGKRR